MSHSRTADAWLWAPKSVSVALQAPRSLPTRDSREGKAGEAALRSSRPGRHAFGPRRTEHPDVAARMSMAGARGGSPRIST